MKHVLSGVVLMAGLCSQAALAGVILQDTFTGTYQVEFYDPAGQSFTAEDPSVRVGIYVVPMNAFLTISSLTLSLRDGPGTGGTLLASTTLSPAADFEGYLTADFGSVPLVIGNIYTAQISATNAYWGIEGNVSDVYSGGTAFLQGIPGGCCGTPAGDLRFLVEPVPEPASVGLAALGLAALGLWRARRLLARFSGPR